MVKALESQGVTLSVSSGSPTTFSAIANISKIHGPGDNAAVIDASNLDSIAREKMMGVPDEGQVTLDIFYDPDAATHVLLRAAMHSRTRMEFKITLTDADGTTLSFFGYVVAVMLNTALSDAIRGAVTIAVDGPSTDGAAPLTYATLDPARTGTHLTLSADRLTATADGSTGNFGNTQADVYKSSGLWYYEAHCNGGAAFCVGVATTTVDWNGSNAIATYGGDVAVGYFSDGRVFVNGVSVTTLAAYAAGDTIAIAFDASGSVTFYKNGVSAGVVSSGITAGSYAPAASVVLSLASNNMTVNFGASAFSYTPPAGYAGWSV